MEKEIVWYRQMAAPGVEYHWRAVSAYPKKFELTIRSTQRPGLSVVHETADMNTAPVTNLLVAANNHFLAEIEKQVRDDRNRRLEQIAAREAAEDRARAEAEQRTVQEGQERQPDGASEGKPVENHAAEKPDDAGHVEPRAEGAPKRAAKGGKRKRQTRGNGAAHGDSAVPQAGG